MHARPPRYRDRRRRSIAPGKSRAAENGMRRLADRRRRDDLEAHARRWDHVGEPAQLGSGWPGRDRRDIAAADAVVRSLRGPHAGHSPDDAGRGGRRRRPLDEDRALILIAYWFFFVFV